MIDRDLAYLYNVETKVLNQAVKRNLNRFPEYFRFKLTEEEYENLRSQFVTSSEDNAHGGRRYIDSVEVDDLDSQTFNDLVVLLRDMLKEKYPKTRLKRTMKSIHYTNAFGDLPLKQSAFLLDEIEQYLSVNKFLDHDKSVEYFNNSITVDGFEVKPENLVLAMIQSLLRCEKQFS